MSDRLPRLLWLERALAALVIVPFLLGAAAAPTGTERVAFAFEDAAIAESSGLVAVGGLFATTNDSGDSGRVFIVDRHGRTVGVTHWAEDPYDVEALAPAGDEHVWVGDIGDNNRVRESLTVARVPVGRGERRVSPEVYELVYPDGAHDAETMLSDAEGRLYVATKGFLGGTLYAAPAELSAAAPNLLEPVGDVLPMATDGALLPDGRHALVRGYTSATLYTWPALERVRSIPLPRQQQGEGLAVDASGAVYLSSEGSRTDVLVLDPVDVADDGDGDGSATSDPTATPAPDSTDESGESGDPVAVTERTDRGLWPWLLGGVVGVAMIVVLLRSLRPR
ncbi:MAG TPA: hypothetical protein VGE38_01165 [Nocardioides sp.]|uniref:hypothetical protein n=1 Tax=Nocardioides sp. TaxID=35761 RepID=UPI002ED99BD4